MGDGGIFLGMLCDCIACSGSSRLALDHMMFEVVVTPFADLCYVHFHSAGDAAQQAVNGCWRYLCGVSFSVWYKLGCIWLLG